MREVESGGSLLRLRHAWLSGNWVYGVSGSGERGWKDDLRVVAALTHVDMIVGMDWILGTKDTAKQLDGTIGYDLFFFCRDWEGWVWKRVVSS